MCGRTFAGLGREERDMSLREFEIVFEKIKANLLVIGFWNLGEPLLNEALFEMVQLASREKIFSIVLTNGTLLDKKKSQKVIESGLDYLGLSIDGASKASYNKYRLGGNFEKVVENISFIVQEKKKRRSLTPFIEIVFLVMKDNESEIAAMVQLAKRLGVDKLNLKKVSFNSVDEFVNISEFLPANPLFVHPIHANNHGKLKNHCVAPWFQATINADGNLTPCCGGLTTAMGNIFVDGFSEIWNGARFKEFRKTMNKDIDAIESCRLCPERNYDTDIFLNMKL
ncbi:MAG: radical SAM protein [Candidatus Omnitrophica bacterium]|nr:radical SAM protein [Candidatus Omnitrophota bacterium]